MLIVTALQLTCSTTHITAIHSAVNNALRKVRTPMQRNPIQLKLWLELWLGIRAKGDPQNTHDDIPPMDHGESVALRLL